MFERFLLFSLHFFSVFKSFLQVWGLIGDLWRFSRVF